MPFKKSSFPSIPRRFCRVLLPFFAVLVILVTLGCLFGGNLAIYWRDLGYLSRPLWDTPPPAFRMIPMYRYVENMSNEQWCGLHGWNAKTNTNHSSGSKPTKVIDAIIFSVELDLLEIRINELWDQVDMFVIAESDRTFTGKPKGKTFAENRERFKHAESKIRYIFHPGRDLKPGESPFAQEFEMRQAITKFLEKNAAAGDLIIMSDADEIPRRDTIRLLRTCHGWGKVIHLQLRDFTYSFEFPSEQGTWRTSVQKFEPGYTFYDHGRFTDRILTDAGWHCSFCFPKLEDFQFKMLAYSHSDRVTDKRIIDKEVIRKRVCNGENIFGMLPEAYTFKELLLKWGPTKKATLFYDLPGYVLLNIDRMRYLLPGGCSYLK